MAEICQSGESALGLQPTAVRAQRSNIVERSLATILAMRTEQQNGPLRRTPAERAARVARATDFSRLSDGTILFTRQGMKGRGVLRGGEGASGL